MKDRIILACSSGTSDKTLEALAEKETDMTVIHLLANRKTNPMQVWNALLNAEDFRVWNFLRDNPYTPKEILDKLPKKQIKAF